MSKRTKRMHLALPAGTTEVLADVAAMTGESRTRVIAVAVKAVCKQIADADKKPEELFALGSRVFRVTVEVIQ